MIIDKFTDMLLFRFSNYKNHLFIDEHLSVLNNRGYVWMLKIGKRTSVSKLKGIMKNGGWLVLRSPKADGSKNYLARFTEIIEDAPEDGVYPKYYKEIFDGIDRGDLYNVSDPCYQWFRIESIESIDATVVDSLVVAKSGKKVNDIINTTRTAVMFIKNDIPIERLEAR